MIEVSLREAYRRDDAKYMLHGVTVPSEFAKSGNRMYVEGHGVRIKDIDGREYIDAMSCGLCANLGYGNQELAEVARAQMSRLHHSPSFGARSNIEEIELARKLAELTPPGIQRFMFTNSGSDADETAIKISRWYWRVQKQNKYKVISRDNSYHGACYGALSASNFPGFTHDYFGPFVPGFIRIPSPYCYRCPFGKSYPGCEIDCAQALEEAIQKEGEDTVGALLAEPVQSSAGTIVPPPEYWPKVMEICKKHNVFLIIDEVIDGFGRMGKFWSSEYWDISPDMMVFSKGLASAYVPIGCVAITEGIYKGMTSTDMLFPVGFTYGGHAVSCAVALKNLEIMLRDKLVENAARLGVHIRGRLDALQKESPYVGDVRGMGLYFGIEMVANKATKEPFDPAKKVLLNIRNRALEKGVIIGGFGNNFTLGPPLIITKDEIDTVLDVFEQVILSMKP